jgi:hypothetical protein
MITSVTQLLKEAIQKLSPNKELIDILKEEYKFTTRNPVIEEGYVGSLKWNGEKFQTGLIEKEGKYLFEGIDYEFGENELGGMIVFSTDVNAVIDRQIPGRGLKDKFRRLIAKSIESFKNRFLRNQKITSVLSTKEEIQGFSVGNFFKGRFYDRNQTPPTTYDERSLSVEIIGISFDVLQAVATELCREFKQASVLVKDNGSGRILLVNAD